MIFFTQEWVHLLKTPLIIGWLLTGFTRPMTRHSPNGVDVNLAHFNKQLNVLTKKSLLDFRPDFDEDLILVIKLTDSFVSDIFKPRHLIISIFRHSVAEIKEHLDFVIRGD